VSQERVSVLETELAHTKENLQAAIEEMETSNQELQTTNEELLASNEELQTTNEELQSVNEELYTVNAEYQRKIGELTELTNDMDNLLVSTDVGAVFLDAELRIRKFTPQMAESFALLPQDVGRPIDTFTHKLHHPGLLNDLRAVLAQGTVIEREVRDTAGRACFLRILPYRARATIDGVVLTLIDVSGLKAAEDALFHERYLLNSLLSSVPDAIYFKDARGRFIRVNHAMAERLGLDDPDQAAGKTALELPRQDVALLLHNEDQAVVASGNAQKYHLEQRDHEDGETAWDLVTRLPLIDRTRSVVGVVGVIRDVTEQKRAQEHVQAEVRRRDEFLAMLSHELRNPLGAIVNATALLESRVSEPERHPATLQIIKRQTTQMTRLLDDLLDAGRVTQNKIELRRTTVDLRAVIEDAIDGVKSLVEAQGHELQTSLDDEPLYVDGDPARLQQVVVNLLTNAAKYTPPGGHLALAARAVGSEAIVTVRDDGMGIPQQSIGSIFDLFVQSKRTLDRSDGGLGVGLTLVRSLVALHGGTVSARSDGEGAGSEFTVTLPRVVAPEPRPTPLPRRRLFPGARVAVVEDNADSREMLCAILEVAGFECRSAGRGDDGLALITEMRPDVALVDVGLPGMSGFDVARHVRDNPSLAEVQLVALTGYGRPQDKERALSAGFDIHLVKPFDLDTLCRLVGFDAKFGGEPDGAVDERAGGKPDGASDTKGTGMFSESS
jgi:two-component system, chemotaxis family, CheB/CheR fusion protein